MVLADSILGIIGNTVPQWLQRADMLFIDVEDAERPEAPDEIAEQIETAPANIRYFILSFRAQVVILKMIQQGIMWEEDLKVDAMAAPEEIRGLLLSAIQADLNSAYPQLAAIQRANQDALRLGLPAIEEVDEEEAARALSGLEILVVGAAVAVAIVISVIAIREAYKFYDKGLTKFQLIQAGKETGNWQPLRDQLAAEVEVAGKGFPWAPVLGVSALAVGGSLFYAWWKGYLGKAGEALVTAQSYRRR